MGERNNFSPSNFITDAKVSPDFYGITPTSPMPSDLTYVSKKLMVKNNIYRPGGQVSNSSLNHFAKVMHRVLSSEYGQVDRELIGTLSPRSIAGLVESLTRDLNDFAYHISEHHASDEFKQEWGITQSSFLGLIPNSREVSIDKLENVDKMPIIAKEMSKANEKAAKLFSETKSSLSYEKGYFLMCLYVSDLIGRRSIEGRMFEFIMKNEMVIPSILFLPVYIYL